MLCGGNLDPHFSKRGDCVKKVEGRRFRLYEKIYFCVIESKYNYRPANSEKNVNFDSSKSSEYAATDTPTSTESGIKSENILLQCNDEVRTSHSKNLCNSYFVYIGRGYHRPSPKNKHAAVRLRKSQKKVFTSAESCFFQ